MNIEDIVKQNLLGKEISYFKYTRSYGEGEKKHIEIEFFTSAVHAWDHHSFEKIQSKIVRVECGRKRSNADKWFLWTSAAHRIEVDNFEGLDIIETK